MIFVQRLSSTCSSTLVPPVFARSRSSSQPWPQRTTPKPLPKCSTVGGLDRLGTGQWSWLTWSARGNVERGDTVSNDFVGFPKIPRLFRNIVITEKIEGKNACIYIPWEGEPEQQILAGKRTRWITPEDDNYGFAKWVYERELELRKLGPGLHS